MHVIDLHPCNNEPKPKAVTPTAVLNRLVYDDYRIGAKARIGEEFRLFVASEGTGRSTQPSVVNILKSKPRNEGPLFLHLDYSFGEWKYDHYIKPRHYILTNQFGRKLCTGSYDKCIRIWREQFRGKIDVHLYQTKGKQTELVNRFFKDQNQ